MLILALDTTTRAGSAAVLGDGVVLAEWVGNPDVTHGQRLPPDLMHLLESAGVRIQDVDLFAVSAGPGSFTGLRVGIATVQGLAIARNRRVVPVSTLDAVAHTASTGGEVVAAWIDGGRGEVFAQAYDRKTWQTLAGPSAAPPQHTLTSWRGVAGLHGATFIGDGAVKHGAAIHATLGTAVGIEPAPALAATVARLADSSSSRAVSPHALVPIYIRRTDAEIARDRRADAQHRPLRP